MPQVFVFPHKGKVDPQSIRTKENALEAHLRNLNIEGVPGPPGPAGPAGPQGPQGVTGPEGGGSTILVGTGLPTSGTGEDGDFYVDTSTDIMYGPKSGSSWPITMEPGSGSGGEGTPHVVAPTEPVAPVDGLLWTNPNEILSVPDYAYVHVQGASSSFWLIEHGLSFYPNVTVIDSTDQQVEGTVDYLDPNTVGVLFSAPFTGKAFLS